MQIGRLFSIYEVLPQYPRTLSAEQVKQRIEGLDDRFQVSLRTIQRDLNTLALYLPIGYDNGWYKLTPKQCVHCGARHNTTLLAN